MACLGRFLVQVMTLVMFIPDWLWLVLGFGSCRPYHGLTLSWLTQASPMAKFGCVWRDLVDLDAAWSGPDPDWVGND